MVTLENITNERNLLSACGQVMQNDGTPGIDEMLQQSMAQELDKHYDATFSATSEREVVHAPERENQENHWS